MAAHRGIRRKAMVAAGPGAYTSSHVKHLVDKKQHADHIGPNGTGKMPTKPTDQDSVSPGGAPRNPDVDENPFALGLGDVSILGAFTTVSKESLSHYKKDAHFSKRIEEMISKRIEEMKSLIKKPAAKKVAEYLLGEREYNSEAATDEDRAAWELAKVMLNEGRSTSRTR